MSELFYLQDSRCYVGNDMLFWAKDRKGYTTDISKAHLFTKEEAQSQHNCRSSDIPWPSSYIDKRIRPVVDVQNTNREEALSGTGIMLAIPKKQNKQAIRCHGCGRFIKDGDQYYFDCPNCGADNRV